MVPHCYSREHPPCCIFLRRPRGAAYMENLPSCLGLNDYMELSQGGEHLLCVKHLLFLYTLKINIAAGFVHFLFCCCLLSVNCYLNAQYLLLSLPHQSRVRGRAVAYLEFNFCLCWTTTDIPHHPRLQVHGTRIKKEIPFIVFSFSIFVSVLLGHLCNISVAMCLVPAPAALPMSPESMDCL